MWDALLLLCTMAPSYNNIDTAICLAPDKTPLPMISKYGFVAHLTKERYHQDNRLIHIVFWRTLVLLLTVTLTSKQ